MELSPALITLLGNLTHDPSHKFPWRALGFGISLPSPDFSPVAYGTCPCILPGTSRSTCPQLNPSSFPWSPFLPLCCPSRDWCRRPPTPPAGKRGGHLRFTPLLHPHHNRGLLVPSAHSSHLILVLPAPLPWLHHCCPWAVNGGSLLPGSLPLVLPTHSSLPRAKDGIIPRFKCDHAKSFHGSLNSTDQSLRVQDSSPTDSYALLIPISHQSSRLTPPRH